MKLDITTARPALMALDQARDIIANPSIFHSYDLRREAWAILKNARQQRIIQHRLTTPGPKGAA